MVVHVLGAGKRSGRAHIFSDDTEVGLIIYATSEHRDLPHEIPPRNVYIGYIDIYPQHRSKGLGVEAVTKFIEVRKRAGDRFIVVRPVAGLESWWEGLGFEPLNSYYYPAGDLAGKIPLFWGRAI